MERMKQRTRSLLYKMATQWPNPLKRPKVRAYSHQGHGFAPIIKGRIHISDFRCPSQFLVATSSRSIHFV